MQRRDTCSPCASVSRHRAAELRHCTGHARAARCTCTAQLYSVTARLYGVDLPWPYIASETQLPGSTPGSARAKAVCNPVKVTRPDLLIEGGIRRTQAGQLDLHGCVVTGRGERDLNACRCRRRFVGSLTVPSNHEAVRRIDLDVAAGDHRPVEAKVERVPRPRSRHEMKRGWPRWRGPETKGWPSPGRSPLGRPRDPSTCWPRWRRTHHSTGSDR